MIFLLSGDFGVLEFVRQNGDADLFAGVNVWVGVYYGHVLWKHSTYEDLSTEC
jgi:hypothetical protein